MIACLFFNSLFTQVVFHVSIYMTKLLIYVKHSCIELLACLSRTEANSDSTKKRDELIE